MFSTSKFIPIMLCCSIVCFSAIAQKDATKVTPARSSAQLSDPSPKEFSPVAISKSEAEEEASLNAKSAGFTSTYFSREEVLNLLNSDKDAVGLRFYNAMEWSSDKVDLVAVAVRSDGSEIVSGAYPSYLVSKNTELSKKIWPGYAETCVWKLNTKSNYRPYTAYFSKSVINSLLEAGDPSGIKLTPASRQFTLDDGNVETYNTMMVIGANLSKGGFEEIGSTYKKSLEPCPYNCPSDVSKLLYEPTY